MLTEIKEKNNQLLMITVAEAENQLTFYHGQTSTQPARELIITCPVILRKAPRRGEAARNQKENARNHGSKSIALPYTGVDASQKTDGKGTKRATYRTVNVGLSGKVCWWRETF